MGIKLINNNLSNHNDAYYIEGLLIVLNEFLMFGMLAARFITILYTERGAHIANHQR